MLGQLEPNDPLSAMLAVILREEHDEVGIGLQRAAFAKYGEHRLGRPLLDLPRQLRQGDDRDLELARDGLERATDARDLEHAAFVVLRAFDELEVIDHHQVESTLGLEPSRFRQDASDVATARPPDEDRRLLKLA